MARIYIVSSTPAVRAGLTSIFAEDEAHLVVGRGPSLAALEVEDFSSLPEVVLVALESIEEVEETLDYAEANPALRALVLGPAPGDDRLAEAFASRPWGYLPRNAGGEELRAAAEAVARGLMVVHPSLAARLSHVPEASLAEVQIGTDAELSPRERQVLDLIAQGLPNKTIAARLAISEHTVKFHVASLLSKLGAASRTEAVRLGARRGLIVL